ncbi:ATP-grasp fold amidoligase family protein [Mucilaginibacter phyllosphaerae]|uniref:ATP-grasp domain-containing protein n=1 Tax=Mucilaginibacter phyllosphaerae TaxID=1812349 RepID=A0A4Y8AH22_9SPHI|nr:ATP-grasp fold amidoligase family protein [Mucilaginibacter phyllosphaerae]MBB3968882.1 hypothetical protein [Mucilaginibacter phyllosphaerae]TEW67489.1 hypothetical protein E2R65_05740 [Mucilaginibacter phyllosphaerae]GGH13341.1 hypothetical protein GCM10007352_20700 [Mucilaginibacter phyllosphaerae]
MINSIIHYFRNSGQFSQRIKRRHETFWQNRHGERVRNTKMSRHDPLDKWMDDPYWQRKLSNKHNAREFAKMHGCKVPHLYWKGSHIDDINFADLPPQYVIRPTVGHSSNNVFVMKNGINLFDKTLYTCDEIKAILRSEVAANPHQEFLVEEFLKNEDGEFDILTDYKFYCFKGEIACLYAIKRLSPKTGFGTFYDEHWQPMEKVQHNYPLATDIKKPGCFDEMVKMVKTLGSSYNMFVRIDVYATCNGCVFGEFTPTPSMGMNFTRFGKKLMLSYWDKYCTGII